MDSTENKPPEDSILCVRYSLHAICMALAETYAAISFHACTYNPRLTILLLQFLCISPTSLLSWSIGYILLSRFLFNSWFAIDNWLIIIQCLIICLSISLFPVIISMYVFKTWNFRRYISIYFHLASFSRHQRRHKFWHIINKHSLSFCKISAFCRRRIFHYLF